MEAIYYSGAQREEILDTCEDRWSYTVRLLNALGLWVGVVLAVVGVLQALRLAFRLLRLIRRQASYPSPTVAQAGWLAYG